MRSASTTAVAGERWRPLRKCPAATNVFSRPGMRGGGTEAVVGGDMLRSAPYHEDVCKRMTRRGLTGT